MASERTHKPIPVLAMVLAWLLPGAGHFYLGRKVRGIVIFLAIGATFWADVGVGGVMTVDPLNERWWFAAEMLSGAHGLAGWQLEKRVFNRLITQKDDQKKMIGPPPSPRDPEARKLWNGEMDAALKREGVSLTPPWDTVARAYAGVAGLLNLLCVFDAVMLALLGACGETPTAPAPAAATTPLAGGREP